MKPEKKTPTADTRVAGRVLYAVVALTLVVMAVVVGATAAANRARRGTVSTVVTRAPDGILNDGVREEIERHGLELIGVIPQDQTVYEYDCSGKPTTGLPETNPAKKAVVGIAEKLFA